MQLSAWKISAEVFGQQDGASGIEESVGSGWQYIPLEEKGFKFGTALEWSLQV